MVAGEAAFVVGQVCPTYRLSRAKSRGLSLEKLRKPALSVVEGNLPVRWDEQRAK